METADLFRIKLIRVSLIVTVVMAVLCTSVMVTYASHKTIIVAEENEEEAVNALKLKEESAPNISYINVEEKFSPEIVKSLKALNKPIVLLDPGHGGAMNGTQVGEVCEKDILLKLAFEIENLSAEKPYKVVLLRDGDETINTENRIRAFQAVKPDYYIGLHLSSNADDTKLFGMEAYYNPDYYHNGLENVDFADLLLRNVATETKNRALGLFEATDNELILRVLDVPATTLYLGYMSNEEELKLLTDKDYLYKIGKGIVESLDSIVTE